MQKDAFYFPHFSNARIDRKIRRMRKELGLEGYGIYFMILETLREQAKYNYPVEDMDLLADEFGTSEQKVRTVVCNYDLFKIDEQQMFFSPKMIMYLQPYLEGKERKRIGGIRGNLIKYKHITKEESKELSDDKILLIHGSLAMKKSLPSVCESESDRISSQSKVNKIKKVNEIDKTNNKNNEVNYYSCESLPYFNNNDFQLAWLEFMKVRKKKKTIHSEYSMKLLFNVLNENAKDVETALTIVNKSVVGGYPNLYPIKSFNNPKQKDNKWQGEQNFDF